MALTIVGVVWFILEMVTKTSIALSVAGVIALYIVVVWVVVPAHERRHSTRGSGRTNTSA